MATAMNSAFSTSPLGDGGICDPRIDFTEGARGTLRSPLLLSLLPASEVLRPFTLTIAPVSAMESASVSCSGRTVTGLDLTRIHCNIRGPAYLFQCSSLIIAALFQENSPLATQSNDFRLVRYRESVEAECHEFIALARCHSIWIILELLHDLAKQLDAQVVSASKASV